MSLKLIAGGLCRPVVAKHLFLCIDCIDLFVREHNSDEFVTDLLGFDW